MTDGSHPEAPPDNFRAAIRADAGSSTWPQRALLVATAGWIAYEWGFGNETVTPWVLVRVIAATDGISSVAAAAAVGFAFTFVQQWVSGRTAVAGFSLFERTSAAAWRGLRQRLERPPRPWAEMSLLTRTILVFTLGTTAIVLIETVVTGQVGIERHRRTLFQSALLCAAAVGVIGAVVASAVWVGRSVPALEPATDWLLRILGNPLFWIGILFLALAIPRLRRTQN